MGRQNGAYMVSVGKPDGKGLREKPMQRWEGNIRVEFQNINVNRSDLAEDGDRCEAVVNRVMNVFVP
jgi:hypothetical protein